MSRDPLKNKLYNITSACKKAIKAQNLQGYDTIYCSTVFSKRGKKVNSFERAAAENFSRLLLTYVESEQPDKIRVELRGERDELLWTKTFNLEPEQEIKLAKETEFQGLGEAEVNRLLNTKLEEIMRNNELEELRALRDQLEQENDALRQQLGELETVVDAKKNLEYYSNIIGLALPGLAKMLSKTALGGTLGMLAGLQDHSTPSNENDSSEKDQRETIIDLVTEFMRGLDDTQLGHLYLVFIELNNNPDLIGSLLGQLHAQKKQP